MRQQHLTAELMSVGERATLSYGRDIVGAQKTVNNDNSTNITNNYYNTESARIWNDFQAMYSPVNAIY